MPEAIQFEPERIQFEPESAPVSKPIPDKFASLRRNIRQFKLAEQVSPPSAQEEQIGAGVIDFLQEDVTKILPKPVRTVLTFNPLVESVKKIGELTKTPAITGVGQGAESLVEGLRSPIGLATMGISGLPVAAQRTISGAFALQMATQTPEISAQLGEEFGKPEAQRDTQRIARLITEGMGSAGFAAIAGTHALKPKINFAPLTEKALTQTIGEEHAKTVRSDEGQIQKIGYEPEGREAESRPDLQQPTPEQPSGAIQSREVAQLTPIEQAGETAKAEVEPRSKEEIKSALKSAGESADRQTIESLGGRDNYIAQVRLRIEMATKAQSKGWKERVDRYEKNIARAMELFPEESNKGVLTGSELPSGQPLPAEAVGMGGALAEGEPAKPELAQLTDSIKTLARQNPLPEPSKVFDFGQSMSKAKDSASSAVAGLKAVAGYMKERLIGKPVVNDFQQALGERHLALSESADVARKFFKNAERAVPDKTTQEAISNWIDTGGSEEMLTKAAAETKDKYKAGYEAAKNLTPEQKTLAQNVRNYFESRLQDAIDAGILEDGIEDYIHRIYEADSPWKQGVIAELRSGIFTGRPAFAKQRVFEYDFEAEKAGKKPIKSFVKRIAAYDLSLNKAIADRTLIKDMMKIKMPDGRPMIDVGGIGTKIEKEGVTEATLIKPSFKPRDTETPENNRSDFKYYDHPALRKWKWASTDESGNPIFVQGDVLVHPDAIGKVKALFERSAVRQNPVGRAMLGVSRTIKQTMLDLSGFHFVQITVHAFEHRTFKPVGEIDYSNPDVRGMIKGGLVVGDTRGYEMFSEGLAGSSLTRFIPGIGPKLQAWNEQLFNSYIPRIKVSMGLHALERNRSRYPELSPEEQYRLVANESNAAFGELNYELLGRSQTTQDMMRLALLAPDFLEARGRFVAESGTYYGREQLQALLGGAVVMYLTARIMNKLLDDEYHFEAKNAFSVVYKSKAYSLRTIQGDLLHVASEPGKFVYTRLNPVYGRTSFEFVTGRDYFGRKRDLAEQAKDFATTAVPISLRGVLNPREQNLLESFLNAFGVTERRSTSTSTIFQLSEQFKKEHHILTDPAERIYDPEKDPYRNIQQAAFFSSPETIAKEIANTVAKGQVTEAQISRHFLNFANRPFTGSHANERKFIQSLSEDQRKLYQEAMQERRKVVTQFQQGYRLYWAQKKRQR